MSTIHSVAIRHFQSLHDVEVELQPFTVIQGPSSSGKSAFTRALRTLVSNRRGTDWITHGERTAAITAVTSDGTVTLTRSRTTSSNDNAYTISPADDPEGQRVYAKLGGTTPEDVSRFLGIPSDSPIQFAGQFDKPFLLDDSAAEVARTLGALTNVNVIFEAARESNRRKLTSTSLLRTRADDLERVRARIPEFKAIRQQDDALAAAEAIIATARDTERMIARLTQYIDIIEATEPTISRLEALAAIPVPDETPVLRAQEALQSFQRTLQRVPTLAKAQQAAQQAYDVIDAQEADLLAQYADLTGKATRDLASFMGSFAHKGSTRVEFDSSGHEVEWITMDEAVRVFVTYLETKAGA